MSTTTVDNIQIVISADTQKAISNIEKVTASLSSVGSATDKSIKPMGKATDALKKIDASLSAALLKVTKYASGAFKESNDYVESINLFNVTMGKGTEAAQKYANELQNLMGIDSKEWMSYQGSLNQMLVGFGTAEDKANEMSQQLTQVAYDLSSVWNVDVSEAFHKVQSGLSGQVKGLKTWGINLSVAQLRETALAHGITLSTAKMTEQQKATLRYITIMEKTKNVQGDLARTIVSPANAMRILNNQLVLLKRAFGQIVSVLVAKFIPYVQAAVKAITQLAESVAKAFGYKLPDIDYSKMQSLSSSANDLDENLTDSTKSAKKLKKTLAGFDEINQLADFSDSTSDLNSALGGGLPGDFGLDLSQYAYDFDGDLVTNKVRDVIKKILGIGGFLLLVLGILLTFSGANIPLGLALIASGAMLIAAEIALNWDETKNKVMTVISGIMAVVGVSLLVIGAILTFSGASPLLGIGLMISGAALLGSAVALNWGGVTDETQTVITDIMESVSVGLLAIGAILAFSGANIPLGIGLMIGGAVLLASSVALKWKALKQNIGSVIAGLLQKIGGALIVIGAVLAFSGIALPLGIGLMAAGAVSMLVGQGMSEIDWDKLKGKVSSIVSTMLGIVGKALLVVGAILAFSGVALPLGIGLMVAGVGALIASSAMSIDWKKLPNQINTTVTNLTKTIENSISKTLENLRVKLATFKAKITNGMEIISNKVKSAGTKATNGIVSVVKSSLNAVFRLAENVINFFIRGLNNAVSIINTVPGVHLSYVAEVKIPKLANGGIVNEGQAFIARERGPELVGNVGNKTAVMNNDQIVESVSNGVYRAMKEAMSENTEDGQTEINVYVGGELAYRDFVKRHNAEVNVKGYSPLKI